MSERLRLFPLNAVLFPGSSLHLHVFEARYKRMIEECLEAGESFGVALIAEGAEAGDPDVVPHAVGSIAEILDVVPLPQGRYYVTTVGRERFKIVRVLSRDPYLLVEAERIEEREALEDRRLAALRERVRRLFDEYLDIVAELSGRRPEFDLPADARRASFAVGDALQVDQNVKQRLLELDTAEGRLKVELEVLMQSLPPLRRLLRQRRSGAVDVGTVRFGKYFSRN